MRNHAQRTVLAALVSLALLLTCAVCSAQSGAAQAQALREQAARFRAAGDPQAALIYEARADQVDPVLIGYRSRPAPEAELRKFYTGQKLEPLYGCYLGVHCFQDERVDKCFSAFCNLTGKRHAMLFDYARPNDIDAHMWECSTPGGPWLQSAFEPGDLDSVVAGPELEHWAKALGRMKNPVFLRWGSEMNGKWVDWNGDPKRYIEKWRLVHDTMERLAPNVVMVWCPNATPALEIDKYYPGDDYVDWVGVNFYVVAIHNNNPKDPARNENPADLFRHVYDKYAKRKPIVICETGVTHLSQALIQPEFGFAAARIQQLYGCLPRLYPRLKAIFYYNVDNLKGAVNGRPFNNYLVTDNEVILNAYRKAISSPYFLSGEQKPGDPLPDLIERLADGQTLSGTVLLSAWAKAFVISPVVQYRLDGKLLGEAKDPGTYAFTLNCANYAPGEHTLGLTMLSKLGGQVLKQVSYKIKIGPAPAPQTPPSTSTPVLATTKPKPKPGAEAVIPPVTPSDVPVVEVPKDPKAGKKKTAPASDVTPTSVTGKRVKEH